jgi:hypothetical protein
LQYKIVETRLDKNYKKRDTKEKHVLLWHTLLHTCVLLFSVALVTVDLIQQALREIKVSATLAN